MKHCLKCLVRMLHPFHDNGTVNIECDISEFAEINWYRDADGNVTG